ncbi:GNAT family N-acetyltransferase [Dehalococcoidia bacterium]|nr:GNAT family N-acetyltransferase [Dehalococcoidia bacterium]
MYINGYDTINAVDPYRLFKPAIMDFSLRPMHLEDIPQVSEIEREAFPTTWPPPSFKHELGNKLARYLIVWTDLTKQPPGSSHALKTESPLVKPQPLIHRLLDGVRGLVGAPPEISHQPRNFITGYVGVWFMANEAHIISIAVREIYKGLGLGELLMIGAVELAMTHKAQCITLEARVTNFPAHALYRKYELETTGIRKRYYADNHEDAIIMTTGSILDPRYQKLFQERVASFKRRHGKPIVVLG